ncbi:MAG: elongation factor Tu [Chloroflexota bacterium]|jgi:translation elongation factor EF-Tu-like GTPase|nr:elongation factor Tu [Chloroflexota bacterium]
MNVTAERCPNCNAPLTLDGNVCAYCRVPLQVDGLPAVKAPPGDVSGPFEMEVRDIFSITGRGIIVIGQVGRGRVAVGDQLVLEGAGGRVATSCEAIEKFQKTLDQAVAGDNVGLQLRGVKKDQVAKGDWVRAG